MWCEHFVSDYRTKSANELSEYYDRVSVLVESNGNGGWTEPTTGVQNIVDRLAKLDLTGGEWPVETCQRTRAGGMLAVLVSVDDGARQIFFIHRAPKDGDQPPRTIVCNHFYLAAEGRGVATDAADYDASFAKRFEDWAAVLDHATLERYWTSLRIGLTVTCNYYASPAGRRWDFPTRWRQYNPEARFTCSKNGTGGGHVQIGLQSIQKRYNRLSLDYQYVKLRSIDTCSAAMPVDDRERWSFVLVAGTVPEVTADPGRKPFVQKFVQFFVIDDRKRKILNDMLCFEFPLFKTAVPRSSSDGDLSSLSSSSYRSRSPSSSGRSLSRTPSSSSLSSSCDNELSSPSSMMSDGFSTCTSTAELVRCTLGDHDTTTVDERIALRTRLVAQMLMSKTQSANVTTAPKTDKQQTHAAAATKLNPRQLFIGCVPLHVKYGQLKLLFERFGEVTYVKVYDGFNKQTGAKMLHNYAFLFFKDEASVERAIAASPVPLDSNWNLNVSRPHQHHTNTVR